jgi:hypothetical protein
VSLDCKIVMMRLCKARDVANPLQQARGKADRTRHAVVGVPSSHLLGDGGLIGMPQGRWAGRQYLGFKIAESSQASLDYKIAIARPSKIAVCSQASLDCKVVMVRLAQDH